MPLSISSYISQIVAGQGKKPGPIHDALQAIANWAAAGLIDSDIAANAAIAISKTALGTYTPWTTYNPTCYKNDGTTSMAVTVGYSRYTQIGKTVIWTFYFNSFGDPLGNNVYFSAPVNGSTTNGCLNTVIIRSGGGPTYGVGDIGLSADGAKITAAWWPVSAWTGTNNYIQGMIVYEAA